MEYKYLLILGIALLSLLFFGFTRSTLKPTPLEGKKGYIYIISNSKSFRGKNWYKVGLSNDPERRRRQFNTSAPFDFEIVATYQVSDMYDFEGNLHKLLKEYRINREWFNIDIKKLLSIIREYCDSTPEIELEDVRIAV